MKTIIATFITVLIILLIVGAAAFYVIRSKKKGVKCIGCPSSGSCPSAKSGCCSCGIDTEKTENK